jgi:hypothetical protein
MNIGALEATTIRIGHHLGACDVPTAKRVALVSLALMTCVGCTVSVVLVASRAQVPRLFTSDPQVQHLAESLVFLVRVSSRPWCPNCVHTVSALRFTFAQRGTVCRESTAMATSVPLLSLPVPLSPRPLCPVPHTPWFVPPFPHILCSAVPCAQGLSRSRWHPLTL